MLQIMWSGQEVAVVKVGVVKVRVFGSCLGAMFHIHIFPHSSHVVLMLPTGYLTASK